MTTLLVMLTIGLGAVQTEPQERPRVPKDSVELTVIGCLEGRLLKTVDQREADVERGPYVGQRTFRVNGKREVMNEVKRRNRQLVEVVGLVRRAALDDKGIKAGGVTIAGGSPVARGGGIPHGADQVPVMDVSAIRVVATSCRR